MKLFKRLFILSLIFIGVFWFFKLFGFFRLPDVSPLRTSNPNTTAFMQLYNGSPPLQFIWVPYHQISPYLKEAVIIAEDSRFFEHHGFDWEAIWDAFKKNIRAKKLRRGGSTITQQLAKNLFLTPSKNPLRKLKEFFITLELESKLSKQRILEIYLNVVEWGEGIFGAEAAAKHYFSVSVTQLTPHQAAWLASILPNPARYSKKSSFIERKTSKILRIMGALRAEKPVAATVEEKQEGEQIQEEPIDIFLDEFEEEEEF